MPPTLTGRPVEQPEPAVLHRLGDAAALVVVARDRDDREAPELAGQRVDAERLPAAAVGRVVAEVDEQLRPGADGDGTSDRVHADVVVPVGDDEGRASRPRPADGRPSWRRPAAPARRRTPPSRGRSPARPARRPGALGGRAVDDLELVEHRVARHVGEGLHERHPRRRRPLAPARARATRTDDRHDGDRRRTPRPAPGSWWGAGTAFQSRARRSAPTACHVSATPTATSTPTPTPRSSAASSISRTSARTAAISPSRLAGDDRVPGHQLVEAVDLGVAQRDLDADAGHGLGGQPHLAAARPRSRAWRSRRARD